MCSQCGFNYTTMSVCTMTPNWCAVFFCCVGQNRTALENVLAPAPHSEPANHLSSVMCKDSFLCNATKQLWNVSNLYPVLPQDK